MLITTRHDWVMVIELVNTLVRRPVAGWARFAQRGVSCRALMLCTAENWFAHPFFFASFDVKAISQSFAILNEFISSLQCDSNHRRTVSDKKYINITKFVFCLLARYSALYRQHTAQVKYFHDHIGF